VLNPLKPQQLESLLQNVQMMTFNRGKTVFRAGDKADGVYLVQEGGFELNKPGHLRQHQDKIVDVLKVDPMAKFKLRKQAKVIQDSSRTQVRLAILGSGELFGLEECQVKANSLAMPLPRKYSVVCSENNSKVIFISH